MDEFFVHIQPHTFVQMMDYLVEYLDTEVHRHQHHYLKTFKSIKKYLKNKKNYLPKLFDIVVKFPKKPILMHKYPLLYRIQNFDDSMFDQEFPVPYNLKSINQSLKMFLFSSLTNCSSTMICFDINHHSFVIIILFFSYFFHC